MCNEAIYLFYKIKAFKAAYLPTAFISKVKQISSNGKNLHQRYLILLGILIIKHSDIIPNAISGYIQKSKGLHC